VLKNLLIVVIGIIVIIALRIMIDVFFEWLGSAGFCPTMIFVSIFLFVVLLIIIRGSVGGGSGSSSAGGSSSDGYLY
jgi:hypothetical protein